MNTRTKTLIAALALALSTGVAMADAGHHPQTAQAGSTPQTSTATSPMTDAEVRKVDKEQKKLTLKHGEIKNLEMPPMTMVFQVKDLAVLDQVKVGDKVRFSAERVNGAITVTAIEPAK